MRYNLDNALHIRQFKARCEALINNRALVDLTEKKMKRTLPQNALYHVWLKVFAEAIGETDLKTVDVDVKRRLLGMRTKQNRLSGTWESYDCHTSEMDKEEMASFLDKFKTFAQTEFGCYLPYEQEDGYYEMLAEYL